MSSASIATPTYLLDGREPVFGFFHQPHEYSPTATAVLICPPFGWEEICSYRSRRAWAEQLAGAGHPTLRIDLPGTGDSPGSARDPDRLSSWTGAVTEAVRWLRETTASEHVAAIGIGLGGLLVCNAVAAGAAIDEVVLWAVPSRGRSFVRELRAFASMEVTGLEPSEDGGQEDTEEAATWAGGFALSPETTHALERLDITATSLPTGRLARALLLERDGINVDRRLSAHLEEAGVAVTTAPGDGYGAMTAKPHLARAPKAVFAQVLDWLEQSTTDAPGRPDSPLEHRRELLPAVLELSLDGVGIRETPLAVPQPDGALFGILTEPGQRLVGAPCMILLNAAAIRRVGPNRMWVEAARRWAARGVPTLRLDLEGIGDADGDDERLTELAELYAPELVDQVRAAIDVLADRGVAQTFVLVGLCSGACWAFHGALLDQRVTAAFMLNPRAIFWDPTVETARDYRRGLLRASAWRQVVRGEVPVRRMLTLARQLPLTLPRRAMAQRRARRAGGDELDRALDLLRAADKQLQFLFSDNEPLREELEHEGRLERPDRWPNIGVELLPGRIHTLRPAPAQRAAHAALDRALDAELQRIDERDAYRAVR
jgi:pimeloyl-ACP methyl ester carboxylesterase